MTDKILAIGLNAALQKTLSFARFAPGEVNRAAACEFSVGGKAVHFAKAANRWRAGSCTVAHLLGGGAGRAVEARLDDLGIDQIVGPIANETRLCTTLLCRETQQMTELIEPSPPVSPTELEQMKGLLAPVLPKVGGIGLCGTLPPGVSPEFYAWVAARKGDAWLLLDGFRDVEPALASGRLDVLKINVHEARMLSGRDTAEAAGAALLSRFALPVVALTDGPEQAWLFTADDSWRLVLPPLDRVVNPLGAGDTTAAIMLACLVAGETPIEAFRQALAVASASCLHVEGGYFEPDTVAALHRQIVAKRLIT